MGAEPKSRPQMYEDRLHFRDDVLFDTPFSPGLDQVVVVDRLALGLLIDLRLRGARFVQPVGSVFFTVSV
jgi:hypothetical protein